MKDAKSDAETFWRAVYGLAYNSLLCAWIDDATRGGEDVCAEVPLLDQDPLWAGAYARSAARAAFNACPDLRGEGDWKRGQIR